MRSHLTVRRAAQNGLCGGAALEDAPAGHQLQRPHLLLSHECLHQEQRPRHGPERLPKASGDA